MAAPEFGQFLERSLVLLREQVPAAYSRTASALGQARLRVEVDGSSRTLFTTDGVLHCEPDRPSARQPCELCTSRATILALVDGEAGLLEVLLDDRLFLRGPPATVASIVDALDAYLAGAVRAPGFPALLAGYRGPDGPRARPEEKPCR